MVPHINLILIFILTIQTWQRTKISTDKIKFFNKILLRRASFASEVRSPLSGAQSYVLLSILCLILNHYVFIYVFIYVFCSEFLIFQIL